MNDHWDSSLVRQCAPTLAGLKVGSLFCMGKEDRAEAFATVSRWNGIFNPRGIHVKILGERHSCGYIYVFRPEALKAVLANNAVREFLHSLGYPKSDLSTVFKILRGRISAGEGFPHEVGVFLGYPLSDVRAFMANGGKNCQRTGAWKAYSNISESSKLFEAYKKCERNFTARLAHGAPLESLSVAG